MKLYVGIDLHSNNAVVTMIDENDKIIHQKKHPCDLEKILNVLQFYQPDIEGIAVESTFNWYWLVDGLMDQGYNVHLVNTAAVKQYEGLKHGNDESDAFWLAHLMRLDILPVGYIYPKETRGVRDLSRKRSQLIRQRTTHVLSLQNLYIRNTGCPLRASIMNTITIENFAEIISDPNILLAMESNLKMYHALKEQTNIIEKAIVNQIKLDPRYQCLLTINGIGKILALTIMLEAGDINRFATVGNYASYCRCVESIRLSNGKKKGKGNKKNGNKYLAWAYGEAAHFCIQYSEHAKKYYQRKMVKTNRAVALKAISHKLARASYYVIRDQVAFDNSRLFC